MTSNIDNMRSYCKYMRQDFLNDINPVNNARKIYAATTKVQKVVALVALAAFAVLIDMGSSAIKTSQGQLRGNLIVYSGMGMAFFATSILLFNKRGEKV